MEKWSLCAFLIATLLFTASSAWAKPELSFFLGMADGFDQGNPGYPPDGVTVKVIVEEGESETEVFNKHWNQSLWSAKFVVDLSRWAGKAIALNITTDPGAARNTNYDWIIIGDAKVSDEGQVIYDIGEALATGKAKMSMLLDG